MLPAQQQRHRERQKSVKQGLRRPTQNWGLVKELELEQGLVMQQL